MNKVEADNRWKEIDVLQNAFTDLLAEQDKYKVEGWFKEHWQIIYSGNNVNTAFTFADAMRSQNIPSLVSTLNPKWKKGTEILLYRVTQAWLCPKL